MPARRRAVLSAATQGLIRTAVTEGRVAESRQSQGRFIVVAGNRALTLLNPDGRATAAGRYYYRDILQLPLPQLYAYESELIQDKWAVGFDGKTNLMRRRDASGQWIPT
jgi:hypothetical protein